MAEAWEVWLYLSTGILQFLVARLWTTSTAKLPRAPVIGLFVTNGLSMVARAIRDTSGVSTFGDIGEAFDAWSNVFLLWCVGLALPYRTRLVLVWIGAGIQAISTPAILTGSAAFGEGSAWLDPIRETPLMMAILVCGVTLLLAATRRGAPPRVEVLIVVVIAFRFAELVTAGYARDVRTILAADGLPFVQQSLHLVLVAVTFVSFAAVLLAVRTRRDDGVWRIAAVLLAAGAVIGVGRVTSGAENAAYFTLMLLRPAFFVGIISDAEGAGGGFFTGRAGAALARGFAGIGFGLVGAALAPWWWDAGRLSALTIAAGLGGLLILVPASKVPVLPAPQAPPAWERGIDTRVALPEGWKERWLAAHRAFVALPVDARERLSRLSRWQRLILVLESCPPATPGRPPPWEATTAGLHALTLCPYASVGAELAKLQKRHEAPIVRSSWGRVPGFRSGRVKWYDLTPEGRRLAEGIRVSLGLQHRPSSEVAALVSESLATVDASRFDGPNDRPPRS